MPRYWLIGYDITEPKRLQRVHRAMVNYATPIEYSIFLFLGTEHDLQCCLEEVAGLMDERSDDVRCYTLPARGLQERLGCATLPAGIHWTGLPAALI